MSLYPCPWAEARVFSFLSTWNFCFGTLQAPSFLSLFEDERGEAESQLAAHPGQFLINSVACSKYCVLIHNWLQRLEGFALHACLWHSVIRDMCAL